jgi:hypothetical protein
MQPEPLGAHWCGGVQFTLGDPKHWSDANDVHGIQAGAVQDS